MSKALWNEELAMIIFCQFYSHMLSISRGALRISTATSSILPCAQRTNSLSLIKTIEEITTSIMEEAWLNDEHALHISLYYFQFISIIIYSYTYSRNTSDSRLK